MKAVKEDKLKSLRILEFPPISKGNSISKQVANRAHDLYKKMVSKKHTLAAIVTSDIFRYALFAQKGNSLTIESFGELSRYDLLLESSDPHDLYRAGLNWIEENTDLKFFDVLIVSSDIDFFLRRLELPQLKRSELMEVASWEVNKKIPISIKEAYLFIKRDKGQVGKSAITIGAVPRMQVDRWHYIGERLAGVIPTVVSLVSLGPEATSIETVYCYVYQTNSEINIGFYNSEGLQYPHTAPVVSAGYELGLPQSESRLGRIVEELNNSIEVLYSHFPSMKVEGIVLLIPPDDVPGLSEAITEQLEIEIISVDPCLSMPRDSRELWKDAGPEFLPLLGAVLTGERDFRFFPQSIKKKIRKKKIKILLRYALLLGIVVEIIAASLWINDISGKKSELTQLQILKEKMESSNAYLQSVEYQSKAQFLITLGDQFAVQSDEYSRLLKIFSNITPDGIYLNNVSAVRRERTLHLNIGGYYDGDLSKTDIALMDLMESLGSRGIEQLRLQRLGRKLSGNRKTESFILEGKW